MRSSSRSGWLARPARWGGWAGRRRGRVVWCGGWGWGAQGRRPQKGGHANVIAHVDRVLGMLAAGSLDPTALVTHHMPLDAAAQAYAIYDRREALKIVLTP